MTSRSASILSRLTLHRRRALVWTTAWRELRHEHAGGHEPADTHRPHLEAASEWLARAQDVTQSGGIARGYSITWNPYFRLRGWEPDYPETTGYIIPTLYMIADHLDRPEFADRAEHAAHWECDVQLRDGGVRAGVMGQPPLPSAFNTGQVIFGWLAAFERTGEQRFVESAMRAGKFLAERIDDDGIWRRDTSYLAHEDATLYNTRTAWALAELGKRFGVPAFIDAARQAFLAAANLQHADGWIPNCCMLDPERPLLHALVYTIRGLLEGGWLLGDDRLIRPAVVAATAIRDRMRTDGWLAGRWSEGWEPAADFSCLTGTAQIANVWMRLAQMTGDRGWLEPAHRALRFLETTQNRTSTNAGLRGGIKGSSPLNGEYGQYEVLSWATKFFVDAVIRYERITTGAPPLPAAALA
ncbi:MAG TPA: hypothetical protein VF737_06640 [Gemmatimonadaceae bacterium]